LKSFALSASARVARTTIVVSASASVVGAVFRARRDAIRRRIFRARPSGDRARCVARASPRARDPGADAMRRRRRPRASARARSRAAVCDAMRDSSAAPTHLDARDR